SLSSSVPLLLSSTSLPYFWKADADHLFLAVGNADRGGDHADRQHGARDPALKQTRHELRPLVWNSALRMAPDDVAHGDRLRNQAELVEAVGDGLLRRDDLVRHGADQE